MEENIKFEKLENKYEKMNSTLQAIYSIIQHIDQQGKRKLVVSLIESGLYSKTKDKF